MSKTALLRLLPLLLLGGLLVGCEESRRVLEPEAAPESNIDLSELRQVDRFGLPAINTVFIPSARKQEYNESQPVDDQAKFRNEVVAVLMGFGHSEESANALADALLPDIQPIDLSQPTAFLNGRRLADDVIDAELMLIFGDNPALNSDNVDANDKPFLPTFPYLAPPHLP